MSIELTLLRTVETLVQKRITRLERRVSYLHLSPALLKDIGLNEADRYQETTKPFWRG
jgi:uncharacterized protein YjiS (DUF1127 family)